MDGTSAMPAGYGSVIGPASRHKGLWFLFGHAHHGLTTAAVTGRIIAEMIAGEQPFCDVWVLFCDGPQIRLRAGGSKRHERASGHQAADGRGIYAPARCRAVVALTAYHAHTARLVDSVADLILVGD